MTGREVGRLEAIARYPVKSMAGERLEAAVVEPRGLVDDRRWAVYTEDGKIGSGKDTRRFRRVDGLLHVAASLADGVPRLTLPDGRTATVGEPGTAPALAEVLGRAVEVREEGDVSHHDDAPVHVLSSAALDSLAAETGASVPWERFRPNLLVRTKPGEVAFPEDAWTGSLLRIGEVVLRVGSGMPRCVMVDLPQPVLGLPPGGGVLKAAHRVHDGDIGAMADVRTPGTLRVGDPVLLGD